MRYIGKYDELSPGRGYDTMRNHMEETPYPQKERVIKYLTSGKIDMVSAEIPKDVLTGKRIPGEKIGMNDGKYLWWNTLAYYVAEYNLRLPEDFENHIMKSTML